MDRENYVMLGYSHILGYLIEMINFNNGILTKIVQHIAESWQKNRTLYDPYIYKRHYEIHQVFYF